MIGDDKLNDEYLYSDEDDRTFEERMYDAYGPRSDWEDDVGNKTYRFSNAYRRFLENGCHGILTYEEAVEAYKLNSGMPPELVTSWPELDWIKGRREKIARDVKSDKLDEYFARYLPYEPMLRYAY